MEQNRMLGLTAQDTITGFKGIVVGRCEYITGCNQLLIQPQFKKGVVVDSRWIDEVRCMVVTKVERYVLPRQGDDSNSPGFDKPAPRI